MPKAFHELKVFNEGIMFNADKKDIPEESPAFSLNVNANSKTGTLDAIKCDRFVASLLNEHTVFVIPVNWGSTTVPDFLIENIDIFQEKYSSKLTFIGTQGVREVLDVTDIRPDQEKVAISSSLNLIYVPTVTMGVSDDSFSYLNTNTTITATNNAAVITVMTISGFTSGEATITCIGGTTADYDDDDTDTDYITITTADGHIKNYIISDAHSSSQTGVVATVNGITGPIVGLSDVSNGVDLVAAQIKAAIEHANGHGGRITVSSVSSGAITLTENVSTLDEYLGVGDYVSFLGSGSTFYGTGEEIMKIIEVDTVNRKIYVERRKFGTGTNAILTAGNAYDVYANRMTINSVQTGSRRGNFNLSGWSNYAGNHIGGNTTYSISSSNVGDREENGFTDTSGTNQAITFSASAKTITFGTAVTAPNFSEGDTITFYSTAASKANSGVSFKILKYAGNSSSAESRILTVDPAPADLTESSDDFYYEANLLKNHTFHHSVRTPASGDNVGAAKKYKVNDWLHKELTWAAIGGDDTNVTNVYREATTSLVAQDTNGGGYWDDTGAHASVTNLSDYHYPFTANDAYITLESEFKDTNVRTEGATTTSSGRLDVTKDSDQYFARGDILKISTEYMKVLSIERRTLTLERGFYSTDPINHSDNTRYQKCINTLITQDVSSSLLKSGQPYELVFYAKTEFGAPVGYLSVELNGGYFAYDGQWRPYEDVSNKGYINTIATKTQEDRWIDFKELEKPDGDVVEATLDSVFRKFCFKFYPPKGHVIGTDLTIEFTSRGPDGTKIGLDLADLREITYISSVGNATIADFSFIDNKGKKDLITFDSTLNKLRAITDFKTDQLYPQDSIDNFNKSPFAPDEIISTKKDVTMITNNREMHIGFGGEKEDTPPLWLGYINHKVFGEDYDDQLYLDEDTVHAYEEAGSNSMSKMCLAGEHEFLRAYWNNTGGADDDGEGLALADDTLRIYHNSHKMNTGDNITLRKWGEANNEWDGAGVWYVKDGDNANYFECQRNTDLDSYPTTPTDGVTLIRVNYRPYYYYGIKIGEPYIYRISPDDRIKSDGSLDTTYTQGRIEQSLIMPFGAASITTCYNKTTTGTSGGGSDAGTGGGHIYLLNTIGHEVAKINVELKYDAWTDEELSTVAQMDLKFKAYKWSNENINGNINGDTEVFGGLASESTPTVVPTGVISDILETKGTVSTFDPNATSLTTNDPTDFDTRLWVQFRPSSTAGSFTEGNRFLFCARTEETNTDGFDELYCADRTPPTTSVAGSQSRVSTNGVKWRMGPGVKSGDNYGLGNGLAYSYYYYYYPDDDDKHKFGRMSIVHDHQGNSNNTSTALNADDHPIPYVNHGWNVGWFGDNGDKASINVARFGLFQVGDNDMDGLLDGTGVHVANNETLPDTISNVKTGPYGNWGQRVSSHAVGLVGSSETPWVRSWGRHQGMQGGSSGVNYFCTGKISGWTGNWAYHQDLPENMVSDKLIFICTDMHFGDHTPEHRYAYTAIATVNLNSAGANTATKFTISSTADLQAGDMVYVRSTSGESFDVSSYIAKIDSATVFTVPIPFTTASGDSDAGYIYPLSQRVHDVSFSGGGSWRGNMGNIMEKPTYSHFHRAFNPDDPQDGSIFTIPEGSGHYTKTYYTTPIGIGVHPDITGTYSEALPGMLNRIEKLNFRSGQMIRPFNMEDDDFGDLIVGNGISVCMPSFPDVIYHKKNGSYVAGYGRNQSDTHNRFASKLFITTPTETDSYGLSEKSKVYACDPHFMYPDLTNQIEIQSSNNDNTTNSYSIGSSHDVYFSGDIGSKNDGDFAYGYLTTANSSFPNASKCPVIEIDADTIEETFGYDESYLKLFKENSFYRQKNILAGLCLSVVDATTGHIETRYIINSEPVVSTFTDATVDTVINNAIVTCDSTSSIKVGYTVSGTGVVTGSKVTVINSSTQFTLSVKAASSQTNTTITFTKGQAADDNILFHLHAPFGHTPSGNNNDKFYVWKHPLVCTAPMRLAKEKELRYGLGSALKADPFISAPIYKNTGAISDIDVTSNVATVTTSAIHNLTTNDLIEIYDSTDADFNSTWGITVTTPTKFTFAITKGNMTNAIGNWRLIDNSESSAANPITIPLSKPFALATFGGLDMRKTVGLAASVIDDNSGDDATIAVSNDGFKIDSTVNNNLIVGDTITITDTDSNEDDGTYTVAVDDDANTFTVYNNRVAHSNDANANTAVYRNQWELILGATASDNKLGEIRAGFTSFDKGTVQSNIARNDSATDVLKYMSIQDSSIIITPNSLPDQTADFFIKNNSYRYKISLMYDGYQEGPLSLGSWVHNDTNSRAKLSIAVKIKTFSHRLSHVCLYRKDALNDTYKLVKEISTKSGWTMQDDAWTYLVNDEGTVGATYEARTQISEILDTIKLKYSIATDMDGYLFVGDCSHEKIKNASNQIFRSKPGRFSIFDYAVDFLTLKSKPTALVNFQGRLYAFDSNNIYRINPSTLFIEDVFEGVGCLGKNSVIVTEYGMFFADDNGAYMHDGNTPAKISNQIHSFGLVETTGIAADELQDTSWTNTAGLSGTMPPYVIFDPDSTSVLFMVEHIGKDGISTYYTWSYNLLHKRWDLWELAKNAKVGKPFTGKDGKIFVTIGSSIYEYKGGPSNRHYTWISKKITMGDDSILKVFNKVKVNGVTDDLNLGGDNNESGDRLIISTNTGEISSSDKTYSAKDSGNSEYKLSGSNKTGRWIQFKLKDMTEPVDSVGLIFRRRSIK